MTKSFAMILNERNDYLTLLKAAEKHFKVNFHNISSTNASGINNELQFIVDVSPNKIQFMFPINHQEEHQFKTIEQIKEFAKYQFENQTVGLKNYDVSNSLNEFNIEGVKTIVL
ncbi:TPA: hypothetical protein QCR36_000906 [Bacillus cereus]|uniref:hypothetical protein n=1 Tax=Bacillus cereus group TaxID=86661 RepID=UPI000BF29E13|nr:hypothetical protein [Bacillus thuringiensis]MDA2070280.1 hypothetical protein [Bacillus cereus]PER31221.1 hypothetical protein CN490_11460 [Bacillus cereus]PFF69064.1 hypothetical protein CN334_06100 [Bacillus thuringiensis]PGL89500.1 hypothetical protein CN943_28775 [Bacillus thuringiensis]HDR4735382.1 hypothetical protein [Bacillus cereus]